MLIHTCHAVALRGCFQSDMVGAWQGCGMGMAWHCVGESNRVAMCKLNWNDTIQILSNMAWPGHGRSTAWYV